MTTGGRTIESDDATSTVIFCFSTDGCSAWGVCERPFSYLDFITPPDLTIIPSLPPYPLSPFLHLTRKQKGTMYIKCVRTPPPIFSPPQPSPPPSPPIPPGIKPIQTKQQLMQLLHQLAIIPSLHPSFHEQLLVVRIHFEKYMGEGIPERRFLGEFRRGRRGGTGGKTEARRTDGVLRHDLHQHLDHRPPSCPCLVPPSSPSP